MKLIKWKIFINNNTLRKKKYSLEQHIYSFNFHEKKSI